MFRIAFLVLPTVLAKVALIGNSELNFFLNDFFFADSGNEEYGPMPAVQACGPLPVSEDDDDEAAFSGKVDTSQSKVIRISALSEVD